MQNRFIFITHTFIYGFPTKPCTCKQEAPNTKGYQPPGSLPYHLDVSNIYIVEFNPPAVKDLIRKHAFA